MKGPFKQPLKGEYHFIRRCFMQTGKFEGFYSWKSVVGHTMAVVGLGIAAVRFYDFAILPTYEKMVKPGATQLVNCTQNAQQWRIYATKRNMIFLVF